MHLGRTLLALLAGTTLVALPGCPLDRLSPEPGGGVRLSRATPAALGGGARSARPPSRPPAASPEGSAVAPPASAGSSAPPAPPASPGTPASPALASTDTPAADRAAPTPEANPEGPGAEISAASAGASEPASGASASVPASGSLRAGRGLGRVVDPERALVALARETPVLSEPRRGARRLGYLRQGAVVTRGADSAGDAGCPGGWYPVSPEGFVCAGKGASLDAGHPLAQVANVRADRHAPLPYPYGMSRAPVPPLYARLPSAKEQTATDGGGKRGVVPGWSDMESAPLTPELQGERPAPWRSGAGLVAGRPVPRSGFAFLEFFETEGRWFGLSADLDLLPLARVRRVQPSAFHGVELGGDVTLPVVFVLRKDAFLFTGDPTVAGLRAGRRLGFREAVAVTTEVRRVGTAQYRQTRAGEWLRDDVGVRLDPPRSVPGFARGGAAWVDVSILKQALVAYRGEQPVYATLVSTGADGLDDPEKTHSTVRGTFRVYAKHVTATMDGDDVGDEFDLRDVPWVQYFHEGYALHAAYWHEGFGTPRSHGCVNLSPADARWLFHFTDPPVPSAWHGAESRGGTIVHIHP